MAIRLIDAEKPFRPVYSIFRHEFLGCLVSSHVVQELENGRLSLRHQGLNPNNFDQFISQLDADDRRLVNLIAKLNIKSMVKKFAPKAKSINDFFIKYFKDEIKNMALVYVNRQMAEIVPLLHDRELFTMGNDGYPARQPVNFSEVKADIRFHFERTPEVTKYYPQIMLHDRRIFLTNRREVDLLTDNPAWMLVDDQIITFNEPVEGRKLVPFFKKDHISIARNVEETYFKKFVPQIVERYEVAASGGLDITDIQEPAQFRLLVNDMDQSAISLKLRVAYGDHLLLPRPAQRVKVEARADGDSYTFYRIHRDKAAEEDVMRLLERLADHGQLLNWEYMDRQDGLRWLAINVPALEEMGIEVVQKDATQGQLTFETPRVEIVTRQEGDWFDIRAIVRIGPHEIPFVKFRKHIMQGRRDFKLPDGTIAILPENWFSDYRHLLEIAEEREDGLAIRPYQAAVLDLGAYENGAQRTLSGLSPEAKIDDVAIPTGLKATLRPYQKKGYDWLDFLQAYKLGGILADDMGLGKTLQTLSLLQREKERKVGIPSLIVMPTSLIYNWMNEANRFTTDIRILIHTGVGRSKDPSAFSAYDLIFTTYGIVRQDIKILKEFPFHYVILDESQMIKNPASKTAQAIRELKTRYRLSLTGTPLENSLMDLWSQMSFLNPGLLGSESFFRDFYVQPIEKAHDEKRMTHLKRLIHPFILRRTKEQVAEELPPKIEQIRFCRMTTKQKSIYDDIKSAYRNYLLDMSNTEFRSQKLSILAGLQKLRQIAIHPGLVEEGQDLRLSDSGKYLEFVRLLEEVLAKGAKVLIFSQFVRLLQLLRKDLDARKIRYAYLDGGTRNRQQQVNLFQNDSDVPAFLISLKAGGVGLNLTAAEYVFILDPWWNPAVEAQAIDRSHRIGQVNTVFSYKFITKGSIEEKIVRLQERKAKLSSDIVSVEQDIFKQLDLKELHALVD
ncbi:MAG: SNF2-related protein [Bacteroidota bacterium]